MATTYFARDVYPIDTAVDTFAVSFPYLLKAHVAVYVLAPGETGDFGTLQVVGTDYEWTSSNVIHFLAGDVAAGSQVTIMRETPTETLLEQFRAPSSLSASQLNTAFIQVLYIAQEAQDLTGSLDDRTLKVPQGETIPALVAAAARAYMYQAYDVSGNPIVVSGAPGIDQLLRAILLTAAGGDQVATNKGLTYGLTRNVSSILREVEITVTDFTPSGSGVDIAPFLTKAATEIGPRGGIIRFTRGCIFTLGAGGWSIPPGIKLMSDEGAVGFSTADDPTSANPTLYMDPAGGLKMVQRDAVLGLSLYRTGLTFGITSAQVAATFAGTAITLLGGAYDCEISNNCIFGFATAIGFVDTTNTGSLRANRLRARNNAIDCLNGIRVHNAYDITELEDNRKWPYVTISSVAEANGAQLLRNGVGYYFSGTADICRATRNFDYGTLRGFVVEQAANVQLTLNSADYVPGNVDGSMGYNFIGNAREVVMQGCTASGRDRGAVLNGTFGTARIAVSLRGNTFWESATCAIDWITGDAQILGNVLRNTGGVGIGIRTGSGTGQGLIAHNDFRFFATAISMPVSPTPVRQRDNLFFGCAVNVDNDWLPSLASANTIVPNGIDSVFLLTGTTAINAISGPMRYVGRLLTLIAPAGTTFGTSGNLKLKSAATTTATNPRAYSFASDGVSFYEA